MSTTYPTALPVDRIASATQIIFSGDISGNAAQLGYDAWSIQGYFQGVVLGVPGSASALAVKALSAADVDSLQKLHAAATDYCANPTVEAQSVEAQKARPFLQWLLTNLPMLIELFRGFIPATT